MAKKFIRTIALTVTVFMIASITMTGCSKKETKNTATSTTAEGTKVGPPKDLSVSLYGRGGIPAEEGTADNTRWTKWVKENMLKDYNVNIKYVIIPRWESTQKYNLLLASDEIPDLIMEYAPAFRSQLYVNKQIMPLDDLIAKNSIEYKGLIQKYPAIKKISTRDDGKMYDFVRGLGAATNQHLWIRNDWLKKLNLQVPKTADELYKVAKAFTENDPDGNGKKDTLAMSYSFVTGTMIGKMFQDEGYILKDGKVVRGWDQMKAALDFKKKLYDEGLVDKDYATDKNGAKAQQDFINGKLGIFGCNGGGTSLGYGVFESLKKNNPNADVLTIALPKTQFGQFGPLINVPLQPYAVISSKCKNPDAAIKYIDFMSKESTYKTLTFGFEGVHSKANAQGALMPIDDAKFKKEVAYNADLPMPTSRSLYKFYDYKYQLDVSDPIKKDFVEKIINPSNIIYLDPVKSPYSTITDSSFMPAWSQDLVPIDQTLNESLAAISTKVIVSGSSYSVDAGVKDAQDTWTKGGGDKLVQFLNDWYQKNKDKAVFPKDIYEAINAMK